MKDGKQKILLAEGDRDLASAICRLLDDFEVKTAFDGAQALIAFEEGAYSLLAVDENLVRITSDGVIKSLKSSFDTPILLLSEKSAPDGTLYLDNCGYNDFILRPFTAAQFKGKVQSLLEAHEKPDVCFGELTVSFKRGCLQFKDKRCFATLGELEIVQTLFEEGAAQCDFYTADALLRKLNTLGTNIGDCVLEVL